MASNIDCLSPLLKRLTPLLKEAGFRRESDESETFIYGRKIGEDLQRIGIAIKTTPNRKREFSFCVLLGIEFGEFPRLKFWQGLPRTHKAVSLEVLAPRSKGKLVCPMKCLAPPWRIGDARPSHA